MSDPIIVVGAGLAGLVAAVELARQGHAVEVLERSRKLGGRARSFEHRGARLNLGPHALYRRCGLPILEELGVTVRGREPSAASGYGWVGGELHRLPSGLWSLLSTPLLAGCRWETARILSSLSKLDPSAYASTSVRNWIDETSGHPRVREVLGALVRLTSYVAEHEIMSAEAAIAQLQYAFAGNVLYLDGGWQSLVDALRARAESLGVRFVTSARVTAVRRVANRIVVCTRDSERAACSVVLALPPGDVGEILSATPAAEAAARWSSEAVPVEAACLDVVLDRRESTDLGFVLGIDRPIYHSIHSDAARLWVDDGDRDVAVVHVARYLDHARAPEARTRRELESVLDRCANGWRSRARHVGFLPKMTVMSALPTAASGGCSTRPGPEVPGLTGAYIAGDWCGSRGLLADASIASGTQAARAAMRYIHDHGGRLRNTHTGDAHRRPRSASAMLG